MQEQLHSTNKENNLLKQCLVEKEQELSVLKCVMDWDKALLEEAYCENSILKQCPEEKEQELGILKNAITQNKALFEEINCKNNITTTAAAC